MKTEPQMAAPQGACKAETPPRNRAQPEPRSNNPTIQQSNNPIPERRRPNSLSRSILPAALLLLQFSFSDAAIVTGNLHDLGLAPLTTKLTFTPTNQVLLTDTGLSGGPPITVNTTNGAIYSVLDAGQYTCTLPLISWRAPFCISVFPTNGIVNITNLLCDPITFGYLDPLAAKFKIVGIDPVVAAFSNGVWYISLNGVLIHGPSLLLEDGTFVLLEDGGSLLLE